MAGSVHGLRVRRPRRVHSCEFLVQEVKGRTQVGDISLSYPPFPLAKPTFDLRCVSHLIGISARRA